MTKKVVLTKAIVKRDLLFLIKVTPESQKKEGILWLSPDIFDMMDKPETFEGFPVKTNRFMQEQQAFIFPKETIPVTNFNNV